MKRKIVRATLILLLLILVVGGIVVGWGYRQLSQSLPQLDGNIVTDVSDAVTIARDSLGVPSISGENRTDVAYGLGFVHGQDRFFQMDLLRRNSAGELAELVGPAVISRDRSTRIHRFRDVAKRRLAIETPDTLKLLEAYTAGVNAGLKSLKKRPFEYLLLGVEPSAWTPEDSILCVFSMYLDLQGDQYRREVDRGLLYDTVPNELYEFLMARGDRWDAPIHGEAFEVPAIPSAEIYDVRKQAEDSAVSSNNRHDSWEEPYSLGSNNWAVSGKFTKNGRALIADDMHLRIQVPHIWYRASLEWPLVGNNGTSKRQMTGVSLPGSPAIVVGSNGHIAWGFTNTEGDWADVVVIEQLENDPESYSTPDGPRQFEKHTETIKVRGEGDQKFEVVSTIWGPIIEDDHLQRPLALRWVAHDVEGVNLNLIDLETVNDLDQALEIANRCGVPHQNFVVGDATGNIAWTVLGRIPKRFGHDGRLPTSWADGQKGWNGYLDANEYPRVVNPEAGRIWTANARVVSGDYYKIMGDSGYDRGARQQQIRDRLLDLDQATEKDMLLIQLDDRALFLARWQRLMLQTLNDSAIADNETRRQLKIHLEKWNNRADKDSVAYRSTWQFRNKVVGHLVDMIGHPCTEINESFSLNRNRRIEGPLWKILEERPEHFLDPQYPTWDDCLLASIDAVIEDSTQSEKTLDQYTWGRLNTTQIRHPLSMAIPSLAKYLDMPQEQVDGGWSDMPRIQAPSAGASQRMAVSPGQEQDGYMQIPCGQSGHPLSPFYANSHRDWIEGKPTPFMPGTPVHTLKLVPKKS